MNDWTAIVYIYAIVDPRTDEVRYVGKTTAPPRRFRDHICLARSGLAEYYSSRWMREILSDNKRPILKILQACAEENWQDRERYWIEFYKSKGCSLTNLTDGGQGGSGKMPAASRASLSVRHKGRTMSEEWRTRISEANKGKRHMFGYRHSPDTLAKMRGRATGNKHAQGHKVSDEARRIISLKNKGLLRSPETRARMSAYHKKRWAMIRAAKSLSEPQLLLL